MTNNLKGSYHDPAKKREPQHEVGELICKYCHAVYQNKHWVAFEKLEAKFIDQLKKGSCPTCHETMQHLSDGVLHLSGVVLDKHFSEIKNIIHNIGEKEETRDIENRIERIEETNDGLTVYTSKNQLAVELGKHVDQAYKGGKLEIKWSKEDKPAEVRWHNDGKQD